MVTSNGTAKCNLPAKTIRVGQHNLIAVFGGSDVYGASTSAPEKLRVV